MKHDLEQDWKRVCDVWLKAKANRALPDATFSISIYELRKVDRGIDYPLRRLLDSEKYGCRIHTYGAPSHLFGRSPFRWEENPSNIFRAHKVWHSIRVKLDEPSEETKKILADKSLMEKIREARTSGSPSSPYIPLTVDGADQT